ncbi:MAG: hypothetical protein OHK0022_10140 [Roseiflexaceae bacterium]
MPTNPIHQMPIPSAYWVRPGLLMAGGYPTMLKANLARTLIDRFLDAGITQFFDLTEEGEIPPTRAYPEVCALAAAERGLRGQHRRFAIQDMDVPTPGEMTAILDALDAALAEGQRVYVHCFAGAGRTGTVIGCHLVRHGLSGPEALLRIEELREAIPAAYWYPSPIRQPQVAMVLGWREQTRNA